MERAKIRNPEVDVIRGLNRILKQLIRIRNMTQKQVAEKIWMNRNNFSMRLNGHTVWTIPELLCVAEVLSVPLSVLIRQAEYDQGLRRPGHPPKPIWEMFPNAKSEEDPADTPVRNKDSSRSVPQGCLGARCERPHEVLHLRSRKRSVHN